MADGCSINETGKPIKSYNSIMDEYMSKLQAGVYGKDGTETYIKDFLTLTGMADKGLLESAFNKENIPEDANALIKSMTAGTFDNFEVFMKNADPDMKQMVLNQVHNRMRYVAAGWENPSQVMQNKALSKKFRHTFQYFASLTRPVNFLGIPVGEVMNKVNKKLQFLHDRGAVFRAHAGANGVYQVLTALTNRASSYAKHYRSAVMNLVNKHAGGDVQEVYITRLAHLLDPSHSMSESEINSRTIEERRVIIDNVIKNKLEEDFKVLDPELKDRIVGSLRAFQKDYNMLNYGYESLYYKDASGKEVKRTKKDILNGPEGVIKDPDDDYKGPAYMKMLLLTGSDLYGLAKETGIEHDDKLSFLRHNFGSIEDGEGIQIRNDYFPSADEKNVLKFSESGTFSRLFNDMTAFHQRKEIGSQKNYDLISVINNDMKVFKQFFTTMTEYSSGLAIKKILDNDNSRLAFNNKYVYDSLRMFSDEMISEYKENDSVADVSTAIRLSKKAASAGIGLLAGSILTMSAFKNYTAGLFTAMSRTSPLDIISMRKDYNLALEGKSGDKELAEYIRDKYRVYDSFEKVSDVILEQSAENRKGALNGLVEVFKDHGMVAALDEALSKVQRFADMSVNKIFGILPHTAFSPGFNRSEMNMLKVSEYMAYKKAYAVIDNVKRAKATGAIKTDLSDKEIWKKAVNQLHDEVFTKTKEMIGDFSKYAKPFWSWKKLRDATTGWQVMAGSLLTASYMFKQVNVVNNDILKSMYSSAVATAKTGSFGEYGVGPGVGGQLMIALYELAAIAMDEDDDIPEAYIVTGSSPLHDHYKYARSLQGIVKALCDIPVTEKEMEHIVDVSKNMFGVLSGGSFRNFKNNPEIINSANGLMDVVDQVAINTDFMGNFADTIWKGLVVYPDSNNWDFMRGMNQALSENFVLFGHSNDYMKALRDLAFVSKSITQGKFKDAERIVWSNFKDNLLGLSIRYPKVDQDWDYTTSMWTRMKQMKYLEYMNSAHEKQDRRFDREYAKEYSGYYQKNRQYPNYLLKHYTGNNYLGNRIRKQLEKVID